MVFARTFENTQTFNILDHIENLTPAKEKGRYICPVCEGNNLTISKDGAYRCWNGCSCKDIREAIAPWEPQRRNTKVINIGWKPAKPKQVPLPAAIELAKADGVAIEPAEIVTKQCRDGLTSRQTRFNYADDKWVIRHEKLDANGQRVGKKYYSQHHAQDGVEQFKEKVEDGIAKKIPFKGDAFWPVYREKEAEAALKNGGNCLLVVEGEPCTEAAWQLGLAAITFQGSGWSFGEGSEGYVALRCLTTKGLVIWPDNDRTGISKAQKLAEACAKLGIWTVQLDTAAFDLPEKGDIVDAIAAHGEDEVRRRIEQQLQEIIANYQPESEQDDSPDHGGDSNDGGDNGDRIPLTKLAMQFALVRRALGSRLRWNELLMEIELDGEAFDTDSARLQLALQVGVEMSESDAINCLTTIAKESSYHPVRDYLNDCYEKHSADTSILKGIAQRYFGTSDPLHQSYLIKHLIASCKRVFEPGEKNDAILVLQSQKQGIKKSTFFKALHGKEFFTDSMQGLDRDGLMIANQYWCIEIAEIDGVFSKKENAELKAFLSRDTDTFRLPYGRKSKKYPRGFVLTGTTNDGEFLRDETGNRRFMVLPVSLPKIPIDLLAQERDRIWGAAMSLYRAGVPHYLSDEEIALQSKANLKFSDVDPWEDIVLPTLKDKDFIATQHILEKILGIEVSKQSRKESLRLKSIMLKAGWKPARRRVEGSDYPVRGYEAPVPDKPPVPDKSNYVAQPEPLQDEGCATVPDVPDKNETFQNETALCDTTKSHNTIAEGLEVDDLCGTSGTVQSGQGFQAVPDNDNYLSGTDDTAELDAQWCAERIKEAIASGDPEAAKLLAQTLKNTCADYPDPEAHKLLIWSKVEPSEQDKFKAMVAAKEASRASEDLSEDASQDLPEASTPAPEFKVGDRVFVTKKARFSDSPLAKQLNISRIATIADIDRGNYCLQFESGYRSWFFYLGQFEANPIVEVYQATLFG